MKTIGGQRFMWDMEYKTRGEYLEALEKALEGKNIPDADQMVTDIKNYFFKRNRQSIGDTEVIQTLPAPEALAEQYDGKAYANKRVLKKTGSAKFFKRLGIFLLTCLMVILGVTTSLAFLAVLLGGVALIASGVIFQFDLLEMLPEQVVAVFSFGPEHLFENNPVGTVFLVSAGIFMILIAGTALKALRRLKKKYHTWTLKKISGCFRLPVSLDDVYSKTWRISVYVLLPISMVLALVTAGMMILGVNFTI